jgi:hypothetical protein
VICVTLRLAWTLVGARVETVSSPAVSAGDCITGDVADEVKPIWRLQRNGGFDTGSVPSRGDTCTRASRPIEVSKAALCYVRNTSTADLAADLDLVRFPPRPCENAVPDRARRLAERIAPCLRLDATGLQAARIAWTIG